MSDGKWERNMLAIMAGTAGVPERTFVLAWERSRTITQDRWLTDEAKALRIVQKFLELSWTPPGREPPRRDQADPWPDGRREHWDAE